MSELGWILSPSEPTLRALDAGTWVEIGRWADRWKVGNEIEVYAGAKAAGVVIVRAMDRIRLEPGTRPGEGAWRATLSREWSTVDAHGKGPLCLCGHARGFHTKAVGKCLPATMHVEAPTSPRKVKEKLGTIVLNGHKRPCGCGRFLKAEMESLEEVAGWS